MNHKALYFSAFALAASVSSCKTPDVRQSYSDVIERCAASDLNGPNVLFFGPSNAVGAGSIWRKDANGVFHLRYDLSQMPDPKNFYAPATASSCSGSALNNVVFGANASLDVKPVSGELKADFKNARTVEAKANSIAWIPVAEGPYKEYVNGLPAASGVRTDLMAGDKYVLTRALKVEGFETTLEFSHDIAASLKASGIGIGAGSAGGGLNASWTGDNKLTLTSSGPFYIAGEFQPYLPSGFAAASDHVLGPPVPIPPNTQAVRDSR
jgi:hypothetical protein